MARKPSSHPSAAEGDADAVALAEANAASAEASRRSTEVAARYGDGLPYDRARVVNEARFYMGQSAEAMLEAGKRLIQIKENEDHGAFTVILEEGLGLSPRTARAMMQAAVRYLSPALLEKRQAPAVLALGRAKLLDLLAEPDEAIEALADGGTVADLNVDEMAAMSTRELRDALKAERAARGKDNKAKQKVIDGKESKITELEEQLARRNSVEPDERSAAQIDAVRTASLEADQALRRLMGEAIAAYTSPASELAKVAAGMSVEYVAQMFAELIHQSGLPCDFGELVQPDWADVSRPFKREGEPTTPVPAKAPKKR